MQHINYKKTNNFTNMNAMENTEARLRRNRVVAVLSQKNSKNFSKAFKYNSRTQSHEWPRYFTTSRWLFLVSYEKMSTSHLGHNDFKQLKFNIVQIHLTSNPKAFKTQFGFQKLFST